MSLKNIITNQFKLDEINSAIKNYLDLGILVE